MKILKVISEMLGWLQIVASPLIVGLVIGGVVYFTKGDPAGLIIGIRALLLAVQIH